MKITILCSSVDHPINSKLHMWMAKSNESHDVELVRSKSYLSSGDLLFLVSCFDIISKKDRKGYGKSLVIHASDLPIGRGWSPHVWQVLEGKKSITVSLLEAEDKVDSGDIWNQLSVSVPAHSLYDEINELLFDAEIQLMNFAISNFNEVVPKAQREDVDPTYYLRRVPEDSELNPELSINEQFDLMRVCDSHRFPAFFKLHDHRYKLTLEKYLDYSLSANDQLMAKLADCSVRPMSEDDLSQVLHWRNHPEIKRYMYTQHEITLEEHSHWSRQSLADNSKYCLVFEFGGEPFGFVSFERLQFGPIADWGFYIAPEAVKGTGTLLGLTALKYAFNELKLHKVCGQAISYNQRSIDFHRKLGFREEGNLQDHYFDGADFHTVRCFGLVVDDWKKNIEEELL